MCHLFESNVSKRCNVSMASSYSKEMCASSLMYLITNQSAHLEEASLAAENKQRLGFRAGTAGRFLFWFAAVSSKSADVPQASKNQWSKPNTSVTRLKPPLLPVLCILVNDTTICTDVQVRNLGVLFDLCHKLHPINLRSWWFQH